MGAKFLSDEDELRLRVFQWLLPCVLVIVVPVGLFVFHWASASEEKEREELVDQLNRLPADYSVTFDSTEIAGRSDVVSALKSVADVPGHHSGPIEPHLIRIKSDRVVIQVCLERDSERPNEFWVSKPRKGTCGETSFGNPYFGRLTTDRLASYWISSEPPRAQYPTSR